MSSRRPLATTAFEVADRVRGPGPWDVFAERSRRFEIHFTGRTVEMVRGPMELEGYGIRVFRFRDEGTGTGFQASSDLSAPGVEEAYRTAESLSAFSKFPAPKVDLPSGTNRTLASVEILDPALWDRPMESLEGYVHDLFTAFEGRREVGPSFGSVRATLTETTLANSAGRRAAYAHASVDLEIAVKSSGGPEGPPPGEYWVNESRRRLDPSALRSQVDEWCRFAQDVRRAVPPPSGELPVVLPASVLSGILPPVLGLRLTGGARLRRIAPELGTRWGTESVTIRDDGRLPWGIASGPVDDESVPHEPHEILSKGSVSALLYDVLHAHAFETSSSGSGLRGFLPTGTRDWRRFLYPPTATSTTLVLDPGDGGTDEELVAAAGDGIWVQQLGWAFPDPISGAFGGEVRIGYRIRGGKIAEPVRGGTVGGLVVAPPGQASLLASLAAIGSKPVLSEGIQTPTLLVRPLTVAGA